MEEKQQLILDFMKDINYVPMKAKEMVELVDINAELVLTSFLPVKYIFCSWHHQPSAFPVSS